MGLIVSEENLNTEKPVQQVSEMHLTLPGKAATEVVEKVQFFLSFMGILVFYLLVFQ